jgi:leader peptidase (prepilin peptidase)/N-methyltransferase
MMGAMRWAGLEAERWAELPGAFWAAVFVVLGAIVGSFLNVCIHRMPREESLVRPPSHCPHCGAWVRWYQNLPVISWLVLRGQCAQCGAGISARYVGVEILTAVLFGWVWAVHGQVGVLVALAFCLMAAGLVVATFIDLEHLIIPDSITLGGTAVGLVLAVLVPGVHGEAYVWPALRSSLIGVVVGGGVVWGILELGKLLLGRQKFRWEAGTRLVFTECDLHLPDRVLPYEDVFYRASDALVFHAARLEMADRCYWNVPVQLRLRAGILRVGEEELDPSTVPWMEAVTDSVTVPREAMGLGDVKFMAAIGAFLGWQGVVFTLMGSSVAGLLASLGLIAIGRREWSARIPYGPYLAAAAMAWVLGAKGLFLRWFWPEGMG